MNFLGDRLQQEFSRFPPSGHVEGFGILGYSAARRTMGVCSRPLNGETCTPSDPILYQECRHSDVYNVCILFMYTHVVLA